MKKNIVFLMVLSCIFFVSSCGTNEKTDDVDVTSTEIAESVKDEIHKEDILSDIDIEYIAEFDKTLDKMITKLSDTYDSTFLIKELFLKKDNQEDEYEIAIYGTVSNSSGSGVEKVYFTASNSGYIIFYNDNDKAAQNVVKRYEGYTSGENRSTSDGDKWEEETEYLLHRTRSGSYGCDVYYFEYPKELLQDIQAMYDEKW